MKCFLRVNCKTAAGAAVGAIVIATALLLSGCGQAASANTPLESNSATNSSPSEAAVDLTTSQLHAIRIGTVGTFSFPVEKEAAGSVSFQEDPSIVQAESTLIGAAATFTLTSNELARVRALGETNGIAQKELEQAISDEQTAEAAFRAARDAVRALGKTDGQIDQMIAAGRVGSAPAAPGLNNWVVANVLESDSPLVREGQPVKVKVLAFPGQVFEGKVSKIYSLVDPSTHRMAVRCGITDPQNQLCPGMLAGVSIQIQPPVEALTIPVDGVVREGDGTMTAWTTTDRRHFTQRIIKTGLREDGEVQILDGLQPGELVVTDGAIFLDNMVNAVPSD